MRVLLDECVPRPLKRALPDHLVSTVGEMRWRGIENGELLALVREAGFEAFVTVDQNLAYQQNLQAAGLRIVISRGPDQQAPRPSASDPIAPKSPRTLGSW